jgi:L-asparaginase II
VGKSGAEGYFCVGHADGLGLALKLIDADPAARARNLATVVAVRRAGSIRDADLNGALRASDHVCRFFNLAGRYKGEVRPTDSWGYQQRKTIR